MQALKRPTSPEIPNLPPIHPLEPAFADSAFAESAFSESEFAKSTLDTSSFALVEQWPNANTLPPGAYVLGTTATQATKIRLSLIAAAIALLIGGFAGGYFFHRWRSQKELP